MRAEGERREAGAIYTSRSHHGGEGGETAAPGEPCLHSLTDFAGMEDLPLEPERGKGLEPRPLGRFALIRAPTTPPPALGWQINPINQSPPGF